MSKCIFFGNIFRDWLQDGSNWFKKCVISSWSHFPNLNEWNRLSIVSKCIFFRNIFRDWLQDGSNWFKKCVISSWSHFPNLNEWNRLSIVSKCIFFFWKYFPLVWSETRGDRRSGGPKTIFFKWAFPNSFFSNSIPEKSCRLSGVSTIIPVSRNICSVSWIKRVQTKDKYDTIRRERSVTWQSLKVGGN